MITVNELAVKLTTEANELLVRAVRAMPADKVVWRALDMGRSPLEMVVECGTTNMLMSQILNEMGMPPYDPEVARRSNASYDTISKAIGMLKDGTDALVNAIEIFPVKHLEDSLTLPFGGGMIRTYSEIMVMPYWNMTYHLGQINFVQTLYGDREMH